MAAASGLPEGILCPVRRGDVTEVLRVRVRPAGERVQLFEVTDGAEQLVPIETVHPAMVIAWAVLGDGSDGANELAVAYALDVSRVDLARRLFAALKPELPSGIRRFLTSKLATTVPAVDEGRVDDYFDRAVASASVIVTATRALEGGDWTVATEGFKSLLDRSEHEGYLFPDRVLWVERRDRSRELLWVTGRFFHTEVRATEPLRSSSVTLTYSLQNREELDDFRFRPGSLTFRPGRIISRRKEREVLDTVAIFSSPFTVEGEWSPSSATGGGATGRLVVSFGDLSFGIGGRGAPLSVFRRGTVGEQEFLLRPSDSEGGPFAITVVDDRVTARLPDGVAIETELGMATPRYGRISFTLEARASLTRVKITGPVYHAWTEQRIDLLEASEIPRQ